MHMVEYLKCVLSPSRPGDSFNTKIVASRSQNSPILSRFYQGLCDDVW